MTERLADQQDAQFDGVSSQRLMGAMWRRSLPGLLAVMLFTLFINVLKLATPIFILQVLDRVVASRSVDTLIMLLVITVIALLCGVALEMVRRRMFMGWGVWIENVLGPRLFASFADRSGGRSAALSESLRDITQLRSLVSGTALIAWLDIFWAPFFMLCVFVISPTLGYIALAASLLSVLLSIASEWLTRDPRNQSRAAGRADRDWISATERNADSVASRSMAESVASHWSRNASERLQASAKTRSTQLYFTTGMLAIKRLLRVVLLAVGVVFVIRNTLTLGEIIAAGVLARLGYVLVERAMLRWRDLSVAAGAYRRLKSTLAKQRQENISVPEDIASQPLVIDKIAFRYPSQKRSLFRNIDLVVEPGQVLCIVGPSARGKTTLTRLVSGLLEPRAGKIRLGDVDVSRLQGIADRRLISFLPQQPHLFNGTVRENLAGMGDSDIDKAIAVSKLLGIHDTILKLPQGYDTVIGENEPLLSQGQRKKIAIARAFYDSPQLIVLDEPLPHLDRESRSALRAAIRSAVKRGAIIVVTAQSKSLARLADVLIELSADKTRVLRGRAEIDGLYKSRSQRKRTSVDDQASREPRAAEIASEAQVDESNSSKLLRLKPRKRKPQ